MIKLKFGQAIARDLADLKHCQIFVANSADEARGAIEDLLNHDQLVAALVVDCVMPQESGVELLRSLAGNRQLAHARRVMITGQATQNDTIQAINDGHLHHYIEKPWQSATLIQTVQQELTRFVIAAGIEAAPYGDTLVAALLREAAAQDYGQV